MTDTKHPWLMLASIYITQYIGLAFIMSAAVAILRQQGVALDQLALLNLIALPLLGKVFYAPIIDKYRPYFAGTYRAWLLIAQTGMTLLLLLSATLDIQLNFSAIIITLVFYALFMSIQDVSVDGLSCKLFDDSTRKFASSIQFSGNLLGNIIGGGIILMLYPQLAWQGSLLLLAALTFIALVQIILFSEPQAYNAPSPSHRAQPALLKDLTLFVIKHKRWFVIMALYPIGSTCGFALLNPMLVDNGWTLDNIGFAVKIFGSFIGLLAALLATPVITRFGRVNALVLAITLQACALLLLIPITFGQADKLIVYTAIGLHFVSFSTLLVTSSTIMMDNTAQTTRKATFFALQFSFASFLGFAYSAISMALAKYIGYSQVVIVGAALTFAIALAATWLLRHTISQRLTAPI